MQRGRRPVGPGSKRLDATPAQASVRSQTHGIPSWEHPQTAAPPLTSTLGAPKVANSKRFPPAPYKPPQQMGSNLSNAMYVTGASVDHQTRLRLDTDPTPIRMLVSYESGRVSCCPSLGDITTDASEAIGSATTHSVVTTQSSGGVSSAPTLPRHNLSRLANSSNSSPAAVAYPQSYATRQQAPQPRGLSTLHESSSGAGSAAVRRGDGGFRVGNEYFPSKAAPTGAPSADVNNSPGKMKRVRSCDSTSEESELFRQMVGLSIRHSASDVHGADGRGMPGAHRTGNETFAKPSVGQAAPHSIGDIKGHSSQMKRVRSCGYAPSAANENFYGMQGPLTRSAPPDAQGTAGRGAGGVYRIGNECFVSKAHSGQQTPRGMDSGSGVPQLKRVQSSDSTKSMEGDIFYGMQELSIRNAPPNIHVPTFSSPRKQTTASSMLPKTSLDRRSSCDSEEYVLFDVNEDREAKAPSATPTFKKMFTFKKSAAEQQRRDIRQADDRRRNVAIGTNAKFGKPNVEQFQDQGRCTEFKLTAPGLVLDRHVEDPAMDTSARCEFVLSGNTNKTKKDRPFLPTPLHHTTPPSEEMLFGDGEIEFDNCSATATLTSIMTPSSDQTYRVIEERTPYVRPIPERGLYKTASSSSLDDFLVANMEKPRETQHLGDSYCESASGSHYDEYLDDCDDDSVGMALTEQENEMLMLALERSLHDVSFRKDPDSEIPSYMY